MMHNKRSSQSYFVTLSQYNRFQRNLGSRGSESSDSFRSELSETVTSFPNPTTTHQDSPTLYHFDEISCAIRDPLSDHLSSSSWICTLREQKAIVFRRRLLDGEILQSALSNISGISHPSLARLLGTALNGDHIFIVYECIADSATLKQCLNSSSFSNWVSRLQVALDVSRGLEYIHRDCDMVHAMISSSSIIVTEPSFNAKIVLFGAASDDEDVEMRAKRLAGDLFSIEEPAGYVAPEVLYGGGRMSRESDVFALGMLILELVSGKIPLEYRMNKMSLKCERISVIETARHAVGSDGDELETEERKRRIRMWADQKLENPFPDGVAEELIRLGLLCVEEYPFMRPEVASVTETIVKLFQHSIAWEQREKGPSTSKTSSSSSTSGTFGQSTGSSYSIDEVGPEGRILESPNLRVFSFKELRSATKVASVTETIVKLFQHSIAWEQRGKGFLLCCVANEYHSNSNGKQKMEIKVTLQDAKSRTKARTVAFRLPGVISAQIDGEKIVVVGDGIDSVTLTLMLKKERGFAKLESVAAVEEKKEKKKEKKGKPEEGANKNDQQIIMPYNFPYVYVLD